MNELILGDNLEIMKKMDSESVDLIYLDPPFFSNRIYEVIWGDEGETRSFIDRWSGGIDHYIEWLKERVIEMHRILKPTGSIYLHCDWHANSYIRVEILDKIFGINNFRSEIIWRRKGGAALSGMTEMSCSTDTIFYYSKSKNYIFKNILVRDEEYVSENFNRTDENGRKFMATVMRSPNPRPNLMYDYKGYKMPPNGWAVSKEKMIEMDKAGLLYFPAEKTKQIYKKLYEDEYQGAPINNLWQDIPTLKGKSKEIIGYPTQKPEALLSRIIQMSTNESELVFDPFVGGGTTLAVAEKLKRNWVGIDQSVQAIKVTEMRIQKAQNLFSIPMTVKLHKYDYDTLRYKDAFEFESWIIQQFGGYPNKKQRGDSGLDGTKNNIPIQVKRSDDIGVNVIKNFFASIMQYDKKLFEKNKTEHNPTGYIIAFSFGKGAIQEVARLSNQEDVIIKLLKVEDIVPISKKPSLAIKLKDLGKDGKGIRSIEFTANGESEAAIEFYSWDFDYKEKFTATVFRDKEGKQIYDFKAGTYQVACKVIDKEGLENIEIIKLKVNGKIQIDKV